MTFEEFKAGYLVLYGNAAITPQIMAACERAYARELEVEEENKCLEPYKEDNSLYRQKLATILPYDQIKKGQLLFRVVPSFEPEYLLVMEERTDHYALTYTSLIANFWYQYCNNNSPGIASLHISEGFLHKALGDQIYSIVDKAMENLRKPNPSWFRMDGEDYSIARLVNGERKDASKGPSPETSRSGMIIGLLKAVVELAKRGSAADIEKNIETLINAIHQ